MPPRVDEVELIIRDLTSDGRAVGEAPDGQVIFVFGAWVGERVRVRRTRRGSSTDVELVEVLVAGAQRVVAECKHHRDGQCGGCPWMFVDYQAQLLAKTQKLSEVLEVLSITHEEAMIHPSAKQLGYRNRAQLKTDGKVLGYIRASSHDLGDIATCVVLTEANQLQLSRLRNELPKREWRPKPKQKWVTLDIDDQRAEPLVNQRQAFRQANDDQNKFMCEWLSATLISLGSTANVVELFCGSGNLTSVLAGSGSIEQITAVEGDSLALEELVSRDLPGVSTARRDLFDKADITDLLGSLSETNGVVLDPPRDGLREREALSPLFAEASWVIYISCNLATWERDARFLQNLGLALKHVEGVDMFPQTPHLEILSVFERG